jgi:hypothetical protein
MYEQIGKQVHNTMQDKIVCVLRDRGDRSRDHTHPQQLRERWWDGATVSGPRRCARERQLRAIVAFIERLTIVKMNNHHGIIAYGGGLARRRPREHFLDYCERVRADFPEKHKLPSARLRRKGFR